MKQKLPLILPRCCQCRTVASFEFLQTPGLTHYNRLPLLVYPLDTLSVKSLPIDTLSIYRISIDTLSIKSLPIDTLSTYRISIDTYINR